MEPRVWGPDYVREASFSDRGIMIPDKDRRMLETLLLLIATATACSEIRAQDT